MERCGARSGPTVMCRLGSFDLSNGFLLMPSGMTDTPGRGLDPHLTKLRRRLLGLPRLADGDNFDGFGAARAAQLDHVADPCLEKCLGNGRDPAHLSLIGV